MAGADLTPILGARPHFDDFEKKLARAQLFLELQGRPDALRLSRYVLLQPLGCGGTGIVYRAHDPELDRDVAIKIVRTAAGQRARASQARLLREARAIAGLSHPNVVAVFDVGSYAATQLCKDADPEEHGVFVVMELVRGVDLRGWLCAEPRSWRSIVRHVAAAARGLAAAHRAGFVHRDFKPANVMVGDDGRVRVLDFGLARETQGGVDDGGAPMSKLRGTPTTQIGDESATESGLVVGTPAYMAPEQDLGRPADARSDQYALCTVLYEALSGHRPFPADDAHRRFAQKGRGVPRDPPPTWRAPKRIYPLVARGLCFAQEDRWPSVETLTAALEHAAWRASLWPGVVVGAGSIAIAAGAWAWVTPEPAPECQAASLAGVWDAEAKQSAHAAVLASGVGFAADTWSRVAPLLDSYALDLATSAQHVCEAHSVAHPDPRIACLARARDRLRGATRVLREADAAVVQHAVGTVARLPAPGGCIDSGQRPAGRDAVAADPQELGRIEADLGLGRALLDAAMYTRGLEVARGAEAAALRLARPTVIARAGLLRGTLHARVGEYQEAQRVLSRVYFAALGDEPVEEDLGTALNAATELIWVLGVRLGQADAGAQWARHARALVERRRGANYERGRVERAQGTLQLARGDFAAAQAHFERAQALYDEVLPTGHPDRATILTDISIALARQSDLDGAERHARQALEIAEAALGPSHPQVAINLSNLAGLMSSRGLVDEALATQQQAVDLLSAALGPDHPQFAGALSNLALLLRRHGRDQDAIATYRRALAIYQQAAPADHPRVATLLTNIGALERRRGRLDAAWAALERAQAIIAEFLGPAHPDAGTVHFAMARVLEERGRHAARLEHDLEALEIRETAFDADHPQVAASRREVGASLLALGRSAEAVPQLVEAVAVLERLGESRDELSDARFDLARALADVGVASGRVDAVASEAQADYEAAGKTGASQKVQRWRTRRTR